MFGCLTGLIDSNYEMQMVHEREDLWKKIDTQLSPDWEYRSFDNNAIADIRSITARALEQPKGFPSIDQAIVHGDSVTLVLDPCVPQPSAIVSGIIDSLPMEQIESLTVLLGEEVAMSTVLAIRESVPNMVNVVRHAPEERTELGYLAANEAADPLYLNRKLTGADYLIPVTLARFKDAFDPGYATGGVFPMMGDSASQQRYRRLVLSPKGPAGTKQKVPTEPTQAAWLLGFPVLVAVTVTDAGRVSGVVAGTSESVELWLNKRKGTAWKPKLSPVELVIACVGGSSTEQTWDNLGRALYAAQQWVEPGGTILLVSSIDIRPSPTLQRLAELRQGDEEMFREQLFQDPHRDASLAVMLMNASLMGRVILCSRRPTEEIEQLGLGVANDWHAIKRLIDSHRSCGVIHGAQFCSFP